MRAKYSYLTAAIFFAMSALSCESATLLFESEEFQFQGDWQKAIKETFNKDSLVVRVTGPYLCKKGENAQIDKHVFKVKDIAPHRLFPYTGVVGKKLKKPASYEDVKSLVLNDYQEKLDKEWVTVLRKQYKFEVNRDVLNTVNKH